jgi:hypothetical protein
MPQEVAGLYFGLTYAFKPDFPNLWQRLVRDINKKIHALPERVLDSFS